MKTKLSFTFIVITIFISGCNQNNSYQQDPFARHTFNIGETDFLLDNSPIIIRSGELHSARIPREYWQHRLKMARAVGLNTVCAYLFWNFIETKEGQFRWDGMADAAEFCRMAQKEGLMVILRPGPYSCAEWEMGGFPWWLLKDDSLKVRTQEPYYIEKALNYLREVGRVLSPLQITKGGPIIMVQIENEYGSFGNDKEYVGRLRDCLQESGFEVPFFTCDGPGQLRYDVRDDIFSVVNFGSNPEAAFDSLRKVRPHGPLMCGEYYPGWFDIWGKKHNYGNTEKIIGDLTYMLDNRASFSIYLIHGGTSFNYWSGYFWPGIEGSPFTPQTSSYDYDAPISEAGWATSCFYDIRNLFSEYLNPGENIPAVPPANPVINIPEFTLTESAPVLQNLSQLSEPVTAEHPLNFEALDFGYGAAVYSTTLSPENDSELEFGDIHDYAVIMVDGKKIGILDRRTGTKKISIPALRKETRLDIVLEAMGRVNFGIYVQDKKGIIGKVYRRTGKQQAELTGWTMHPMNIEDGYPKNIQFTESGIINTPAFYRGTFIITRKGDTFLDMSNWGKGLVWVNGHGLGRFWNIGPTQTMYLPGPWLKEGENEIIVLDYLSPESLKMQGLEKPILDSLRFQ